MKIEDLRNAHKINWTQLYRLLFKIDILPLGCTQNKLIPFLIVSIPGSRIVYIYKSGDIFHSVLINTCTTVWNLNVYHATWYSEKEYYLAMRNMDRLYFLLWKGVGVRFCNFLYIGGAGYRVRFWVRFKERET